MHRILVGSDAYVNVSNGNLNCTVWMPHSCQLRLAIAGSEPPVDYPDFIPHKQGPNNGKFSARNLEAEDDLWARAESKDVELQVMRGTTVIEFN